MNKNYAFLIITLIALVGTVNALPTKWDYLNVTRQECGLTSCTTYYLAHNPTGNAITIDGSKLKIANYINFIGSAYGFVIFYYNGTAYTPFTNSTIISLAGNSYMSLFITGGFNPQYSGRDKLSYSIDHIPSFMGYTFPEYDLWNQSFNKCLNINLTYNLGAYSSVNETFPQRILLNSSIVNLSATRSDWQDGRWGKGTCQNVTSDYKHSIVYANSTNAEMIVYISPGDIINNTALSMVYYYNSTASTHIEPTSSSVGFVFAQTNIYTNDAAGDNASVTQNEFNEGISYPLNTYGSASLITGSYGYEKLLGTNSLLYMSPLNGGDLSQIRGVGSLFRIRLNNWNQTGRQYLSIMGNSTDYTNTGLFSLYIE
jgi:hypothetical protein